MHFRKAARTCAREGPAVFQTRGRTGAQDRMSYSAYQIGPIASCWFQTRGRTGARDAPNRNASEMRILSMGTKCPILHTRHDQLYPIGFSYGAVHCNDAAPATTVHILTARSTVCLSVTLGQPVTAAPGHDRGTAVALGPHASGYLVLRCESPCPILRLPDLLPALEHGSHHPTKR
jgi:hypothetical protein